MNENVISQICKYLTDNINEEISDDIIADTFHYNKFYLVRKFKEYTGFTINEYVNECRVYNSTNPLIFTDKTILNIALNNGFNSLEYYSEKFKDIIGTSPLKFRKIYTGLLEIANKTNDKEELSYVKSTIEKLQEYQDYLQNMDDMVITKEEKPKVKVLTKPFSKAT